MWVVLVIFGIIVAIAFLQTFWPYILTIAIIALVIFVIYWINESNKKDARREEILNHNKFNQKITEVKNMVDLLRGTIDSFNTFYYFSKSPHHSLTEKRENEYIHNDWSVFLHITMHEVSNYTLKTISVFPRKREEIEEFFVKRMFNKSYDEAKEIIDIYDWIVAVNEGEIKPDSTYDESTIFFTIRISCAFRDYSKDEQNELTLKGDERNIFLDKLKELGCNVKY